MGVPIASKKVRGGTVVEWIGYELGLREYRVGVLEGRAASTAAVGEGVERPFLSAIHKFLVVEERDVVRPLPAYVLLSVRCLEHSLAQRHHIDCASRPLPFLSAVRVDAQAGEGTVGIGAWWPYHDEGEQLRKDLSLWLAVLLTPEDSPWAFRADGESHRVVSGLEAYAVLMGLKFLLPPHMNGNPGKHLVVAPVLTDNQGNGHALSKLHSCRFPLAAVIMEMSEELKAGAMTAEVQWAPRERNQEADALSNLQFAEFSAECRVAVSIPDIRWHIFDQALQWGAEFETQARANWERHGPLRRCLKSGRRKKPEERLRLRDLW